MRETTRFGAERVAIGACDAKPLVVLVPDAIDWILGAWAQEITAAQGDAFDFCIFPLEEIEARPARFDEVVAECSAVHCLTQSAYAAVADRVRSVGVSAPPLIATIHHIVGLEDVRPCVDADRIMVECGEVQAALVAQGVSEDSIFLLRKGVDTEVFRPSSRTAARARLELPDAGFTLGFSAKADSDDSGRKGVDVFLEAVARLREGCDAPLHVAVTGPGWEATLAANPIAGIDFHYFPFLAAEAMPDFYNAIDVFVSTSRIEGGPLPPFEAMSCEVPVVITPVGTVCDLASDGGDALIVPIDDAARTAAAVERLRSNPELARKLGFAGRELVIRSFEVSACAAAAHGLYAPVTAGGPSGAARGLTQARIQHLNDELATSDRRRWRARIAARRAESLGGEVAHVDLGAIGAFPGARVLDLGCGTGQLSVPLGERGFVTVSIDLDAARLREVCDACLEKGLALRALRADGAALPCAAGSFDAVVCREVIEHIERPGPVLDEIHRVLAVGGRLCVTVPSAHTERYFQWVDSNWLAMAGHVNVFSRGEMRELLEGHGFRVVEIRGRNFFYALFWFFHTLARTRHDGTGRIQEHFRMAHRIFRAWGWLGEGRLKRSIEAVGNRVFPKCYVYYCERLDDA